MCFRAENELTYRTSEASPEGAGASPGLGPQASAEDLPSLCEAEQYFPARLVLGFLAELEKLRIPAGWLRGRLPDRLPGLRRVQLAGF